MISMTRPASTAWLPVLCAATPEQVQRRPLVPAFGSVTPWQRSVRDTHGLLAGAGWARRSRLSVGEVLAAVSGRRPGLDRDRGEVANGVTGTGACRYRARVTGSATTVPSTTAPSTTAPSAAVPSITVPSTTVPSITVPSITVPSASDLTEKYDPGTTVWRDPL
jgi:hypothetical protein